MMQAASVLALVIIRSGVSAVLGMLGIIGAAIASAIFTFFGIALGGWIGCLISGFIGALVDLSRPRDTGRTM